MLWLFIGGNDNHFLGHEDAARRIVVSSNEGGAVVACFSSD